MNQQLTLRVTSLLSVLLFSLHWADEISRGLEPGTLAGTGGLAILFVWLYAALILSDRRLGLVLLLLGAFLASAVPLLHMSGAGLVGKSIAANSPGAFFWVWTNLALGASGMISVALAVLALWNWPKRPFEPSQAFEPASDLPGLAPILRDSRGMPQALQRPALEEVPPVDCGLHADDPVRLPQGLRATPPPCSDARPHAHA